MSGHTPGPWIYDDDTATVDTKLGVAVAGINDEHGWEVTEANARLIAAAPDLLAVVKALVDAKSLADLNRLMSSADAAIAKAEGRES